MVYEWFLDTKSTIMTHRGSTEVDGEGIKNIKELDEK